MAYLGHPKVMKVAYNHLHHNVPVVNTIHWYFNGTLTQGIMDSFCFLLDTYWSDRILTMQSFQLGYYGLHARQMVEGGGLAVDVDLTEPIYGAITVDSDRTAEAVALKLRSGNVGRSNTGRIFMGGVPNNTVHAGLVDNQFRVNWATTLSNYFSALKQADSNWAPVVVSKQSNRSPRPAVVLSTITDARSVTRYPAHVSSRNRKQN